MRARYAPPAAVGAAGTPPLVLLQHESSTWSRYRHRAQGLPRSAAHPELVASFVNRSNLLKLWEKTDLCAVSTSGAHGSKNTAITRIPAHALPRSRTHFSDRTALVWRCCHTPGPIRAAS